MKNKLSWLGILVMVLVFGMMVSGCDNDTTTNSNGTTYDPTGTWDFTVSGQSATVTITGINWVFDGPGTTYDDSGTFTQNGNVGTLYSNAWEANIGTATLMSNTTMNLTLRSPSLITGTFAVNKR
jgi:hypothetical protein